MLPMRDQHLLRVDLKNTYHACWKEDSWLDIVQQDVTWYLPNRVSNSEDSIDLVELIAFKAQLFFHARNIRLKVSVRCQPFVSHVFRHRMTYIVQICPIKIVDEVHKTAECQDKEVELLYQFSFAWRILLAAQVLDEAVAHFDRC